MEGIETVFIDPPATRRPRGAGTEEVHDRRVDPVERELRVHPEDDHDAEQRRQRRPLAPVEVGDADAAGGHVALEDLLVRPEKVDGGDHDAKGGDAQDPTSPAPVEPDEHEELAHEAIEARQSDRGEHGHREGGREHGGRALDAADTGHERRAGALREEADEQEEGGGHDPVVEHQEHRAPDAGPV